MPQRVPHSLGRLRDLRDLQKQVPAGQRHVSKQIEIHTIGTKVSFVHHVVAPTADLEMLRVDTSSVVTPVTNHVVIAGNSLPQHAINEAISCHLPVL